jgi:hypothetical protein
VPSSLYCFQLTTGFAQFSEREQGIRDKHPNSDSLWLGNLKELGLQMGWAKVDMYGKVLA